VSITTERIRKGTSGDGEGEMNKRKSLEQMRLSRQAKIITKRERWMKTGVVGHVTIRGYI
jgi:hypothetical protein